MTKEAVASAGSPEDGLRAFLSLHLQYGIKNKELILINIREHGFGFGRDVKRKFLRSQIELLMNILNKGITERVFRECNTEEASRIIMATLRGIVLSMVLEGESVITESGLGDLIIRGLLRTDKEDFRGKISRESEERRLMSSQRNRTFLKHNRTICETIKIYIQ